MKGQLIFNILLLGAHFGFTISNEHQRIINGKFAVAKQFPYQVFYDVLDLSNLGGPIEWAGKCGGTLISKRIILTAARCFYAKPVRNIYAVKIYFGAVDKSNNSEIGQQQLSVTRTNVVVHNEFDPSTVFNDIALIKLPIDVAFDDYIRPAKLPQPDIIYDSRNAIVSGWGAIKVLANGTEIYQPKLKYFNTSVLSHAECRQWMQTSVVMEIPSSKLCIAPSEDTPCRRDTGGPLTVRHNGDLVLLGIASYVYSHDCKVNTPSVYTRVASYINWIIENAGPHNLDE